MTESVEIRHSENMAFEATVNGHKIMIDTAEEFGGTNQGPRPKSLMMVALAGCTGMDVVSILRKMRVEFTDVRVKVEGNITGEHPKHYDHMHIIYIVKGKNLPLDKVESAVNMSKEKYCGVSYNYKASMKITHEIVIEE